PGSFELLACGFSHVIIASVVGNDVISVPRQPRRNGQSDSACCASDDGYPLLLAHGCHSAPIAVAIGCSTVTPFGLRCSGVFLIPPRRITLAAQARPPPKATKTRLSSSLTLPAASASQSAIGMEAAEVLPYLSRFTQTLSMERSSRRAAASMMRRLA